MVFLRVVGLQVLADVKHGVAQRSSRHADRRASGDHQAGSAHALGQRLQIVSQGLACLVVGRAVGVYAVTVLPPAQLDDPAPPTQ